MPRGTVLTVELVDPVSSGRSKAGETFRTKLQDGVWLRGRVAVPPGATVRGAVTEAAAAGRLKGKAKLSLTLSSLELEGRSYELHTDTLTYSGSGHGGKHFGSGFMGALQGALYGVLFGGKDGAIIGAGAGAAAGAAGSVFGGKEDITFLQGAKLMFETQAPVRVPEPPVPGSGPPGQPVALPAANPPPAAAKPQQRPALPEERSGKPAG